MTTPEEPIARVRRLMGEPSSIMRNLLELLPSEIPELHVLLMAAPTDTQFLIALQQIVAEMAKLDAEPDYVSFATPPPVMN